MSLDSKEYTIIIYFSDLILVSDRFLLFSAEMPISAGKLSILVSLVHVSGHMAAGIIWSL